MNLFFGKYLIQKIALGYTLAILLLVTLPINGEDQLLGHLNDNYVLRIRLDYLFHALLFMPWVFLGAYGWELNSRSRLFFWLSLIGALSFAVLCEYVQLWLPYRTFNINDLVSNCLGVILGYLFAQPLLLIIVRQE